MTNIFSVATNGAWWRGTLSVRYNLLTVVKIIGALLALVAIGFGLYWLGIGILALLELLWSGICWFFSKWLWWLIIAVVALVGWLLSKLNWDSIKWPGEEEEKQKNRSYKWLWLLLLLLLLIGGGFWLFKSCSGENKADNISSTVIEEPFEETFNEAFDWVVTTRAYLDGVQDGQTKTEVALVGLKFVNGQPVTKMTFEGKTYEEAKEIIARDWRKLVADNVHVSLTKKQMVVVTLFAMRNGKYGFEKSDFLRSINEGNFDTSLMAIHKANGTKRQLGTEGLQYLWVLKNLASDNLSLEELLDLPMFSYKAIGLTEMYDAAGNPRFNDALKARLKQGNFRTPRQALDL